MGTYNDHKVSRWRYSFIYCVFFLLAAGLLARLAYLMVIDRSFLLGQGDSRTLRVVDIPAYRGLITDRHGQPLAMSTPVKSIWMDPHQIEATPEQLHWLAQQLSLNDSTLQNVLQKNKTREFVYLKRHVSPALAEHVQAAQIPGVHFDSEYRRYYPEGVITAHVLGVTNIDDEGQEGLELAFDSWLKGVPGKKQVLKDRLGNRIADVANLRAPHPGQALVLSLDRRIQYLAHQVLQQAVTESQSESGSAVVLDVRTGEVLAMVNVPVFNPNSERAILGGNHRNRAVTDVFEPGSTMKAFSIASALDSGEYTADSLVDTDPGWMMIDGNTVKDLHNNGMIDVETVLKRSSNVGVAKLTLSLPPEQLWQVFRRFGFGQTTGSGFPGERSGSLIERRFSRPFVLATLAFGYGVSVTPLQLAQAYATVGNQGIRQTPTFLKCKKSPKGERVLAPDVADSLLSMLTAAVETGGTGKKAKVPGYWVAGKTGTSRIAGPSGYDRHAHIASFAGLAPASHPRLAVVTVIRHPEKGSYYGSQLAAPVFSKIMSGALRILNIPPDHRQPST